SRSPSLQRLLGGENVQDRTFLLQRPVTECTADRCGLPFAEAPRRAPSEEPFDVAGAHTIDREIERAREERAHLRQCDLVAPLRVRRELRKLVSFILIEKRGHGDEAGESVLLALGLFHQLRILRPGELFCDPLVARLQRELVPGTREGQNHPQRVAAPLDAPWIFSRPHRVVRTMPENPRFVCGCECRHAQPRDQWVAAFLPSPYSELNRL